MKSSAQRATRYGNATDPLHSHVSQSRPAASQNRPPVHSKPSADRRVHATCTFSIRLNFHIVALGVFDSVMASALMRGLARSGCHFRRQLLAHVSRPGRCHGESSAASLISRQRTAYRCGHSQATSASDEASKDPEWEDLKDFCLCSCSVPQLTGC